MIGLYIVAGSYWIILGVVTWLVETANGGDILVQTQWVAITRKRELWRVAIWPLYGIFLIVFFGLQPLLIPYRFFVVLLKDLDAWYRELPD